ncbi:MAG: T9SS type A sorting domain-containing protein [bacterium]|nr:T9SS type A sorting domain-containing protein [bacterium]
MKTITTKGKHAVLFVMILLATNGFSQQLQTPMQFIVNSPGAISGELFYGYPVNYGPTTMTTITGDIEWVYDLTPDSLACDSILDDLTGKIAMIRRGACSFTTKVYNAQQKGAIACVLVNNSGTTEVLNTNGTGQTITIPSIMISYNDGLLIDSELSAGNPVNVSFLVPTIHGASISYAHTTPLERIIPHENMSTSVYNNTGVGQSNVDVTLDITDPLGAVTNFTTQIASLAIEQDSTVIFPGMYTPTMVGSYFGTIKSSLNPSDSIVIPFVVSDNTYALDNADFSDVRGVIPMNASFSSSSYEHHRGAVYQASPTAFNGDYITATFALENATDYIGETFEYVLYTPNDSISSFFQNETDYSTFIVRGTASRTISASDAAVPHTLLTDTLIDPNTGNFLGDLLPNVDYMLVVKYAGNGLVNQWPKFSHTHREDNLKLDQTVHVNQQLNLNGYESSFAPVMRLGLIKCSSTFDQSFTECPGTPITVGTSVYTTAGIYTDTLTNSVGCDSIITTDLAYITIDTNINYSGTDLVAQETGAQYQWVDCNNGNAPITGETGQTFTPSTNGTYAVEITVNGCTVTSNCLTTALGLDDWQLAKMEVHPNPTDGWITVSTSISGKVNFSLTELDGRHVKEGVHDDATFNIDLSEIKSGVYLLHLYKDNKVRTFRVVKQ